MAAVLDYLTGEMLDAASIAAKSTSASGSSGLETNAAKLSREGFSRTAPNELCEANGKSCKSGNCDASGEGPEKSSATIGNAVAPPPAGNSPIKLITPGSLRAALAKNSNLASLVSTSKSIEGPNRRQKHVSSDGESDSSESEGTDCSDREGNAIETSEPGQSLHGFAMKRKGQLREAGGNQEHFGVKKKSPLLAKPLEDAARLSNKEEGKLGAAADGLVLRAIVLDNS